MNAFIATGFIGDPVNYRADPDKDPWGPGDPAQMARELQQKMDEVPGGDRYVFFFLNL